MPGYRNPEGVVVYHYTSKTRFKYILNGDENKAAG
jgi:hypothetical protein